MQYTLSVSCEVRPHRRTISVRIASQTAWLQHQQVSEVVMESTAQYWRLVWYGLEGHFQLHLRKFNRLLRDFGRLGLDVRALLDQQLPAPA